jgi:hypothetical protein
MGMTVILEDLFKELAAGTQNYLSKNLTLFSRENATKLHLS